MTSPITYHVDEQCMGEDASHSPSQLSIFDPQFVTSGAGPQFDSMTSTTTVYPSSFATSSIYDIDPPANAHQDYSNNAAAFITAPIPAGLNIASSPWNVSQEAIYSTSYGSPTFSMQEFSFDPRSPGESGSGGFNSSIPSSAITFDDQSQTSSQMIRSDSAPMSLYSSESSPAPPVVSPPAKKRRGRKPKAVAAAPRATTITTSSTDSVPLKLDTTTTTADALMTDAPSYHMPPRRRSTASKPKCANTAEEARQITLQRNRIAAAKCRTKRSAAENDLMSHEHDIESRNVKLKSNFVALRQELLDLKAKIHYHAHCDCELIQQYISNEARRYVTEGGGGEFSALIPAADSSTT